ncbi:MAG: hypothetical protein A2Y18_07875, partial [Clostridiales bacterium GWD2_32_19]
TIAIPIFTNKSETSKQIAHNENVRTLQTQAQAYLWEEGIAMPQANIIDDMATKGYIKEVPNNPLETGAYVVAVSASGIATVTPIIVEVTGEPEPPPVVADVPVGNYIKFGTYLSQPIVWRVINKVDAAYLTANPGSGLHEGDLMLLSDKIISLKAFDANGENLITEAGGDTSRGTYGSNYWDKSSLKAWLNSSAGDGVVDWLGYFSPTAARVFGSYNPYDAEKGFLAEGNFNATERSKIMPVTHKTILADTDAATAAKTGGTASHTYTTTNASAAVENYASANYKDTTESVFLLGIKELNDYVYSNGALGDGVAWTKAYPTSEAVTQSTAGGYTDAGLNTGAYWYYWLRESYAPYSYSVRVVFADGLVFNNGAYGGTRGVRPALFLSPSGMTLDGASGASVGEANTITWE